MLQAPTRCCRAARMTQRSPTFPAATASPRMTVLCRNAAPNAAIAPAPPVHPGSPWSWAKQRHSRAAAAAPSMKQAGKMRRLGL